LVVVAWSAWAWEGSKNKSAARSGVMAWARLAGTRTGQSTMGPNVLSLLWIICLFYEFAKTYINLKVLQNYTNTTV
jgi:hypothetical protein